MRVLAVSNQKGGVGKTTTSVSLGGIAAENGMRTLLVDLDPQCSLTAYFGFDPDRLGGSTYNLFTDPVDACALIIKSTKVEGLSIFPASPSLATLDRKLGTKDGGGLFIKRGLWKLRDMYDQVIIDCPPNLGLLMINAMASANRLIMPVQTEFLAIKGLERMISTLGMVGSSIGKTIEYLIVPTMYDQRTNAARSSLEYLQKNHAGRIWNNIIPVDTRLRDASRAGEPISLFDRNSRAGRAYFELARSIDLSSGASSYGPMKTLEQSLQV